MHLSPAETAKVCAAAAVHDVGKLFTPRTILNKPGRLTEAEFDVVKQHTTEGAEMLEGVGDPEIAAMVRHHHERIDGRGYPDGLSGREIPLGARIIAVADTFDAIVSNRAYRRACTQKRALEALAGGAGTQLDSVAVTAFGHRYRDRRSLAVTALATAGAQRLFVALQTAAQSVGGIAPLLPALGAASVLGLSSPAPRGALGLCDAGEPPREPSERTDHPRPRERKPGGAPAASARAAGARLAASRRAPAPLEPFAEDAGRRAARERRRLERLIRHRAGGFRRTNSIGRSPAGQRSHASCVAASDASTSARSERSRGDRPERDRPARGAGAGSAGSRPVAAGAIVDAPGHRAARIAA